MYPLAKQFLMLLVLTALGSAYSLVSGLAPQPWAAPEVAPGEILMADARALDVLWVDARSAEAFLEASAPDAIHYDPHDGGRSLGDVVASWLKTPRVIIVYCSDAGCGTSREVAASLRTVLPEAEVYSLKGGWESWTP